MTGRAATNITGTNQSYFFKGDKYVKIKWTPGTTDEEISYGPTEFVKEWASLKETGFTQIDAILPIPGHDHRAYFFSGDKYARIEYVPGGPGDKILGGVRSIADNWASLKKAGFDSVDGALIVPGKTDEAYIFSGEKYARIKFTEGQTNDELLDGPKAITTGWSVTKFHSFDTIIPRPGNNQNTYIFSGDKYVQIKVNVGGYDDLISDQRDVAPYWPSLHKAGFY
ncbi:Hemopexin-like domain-containing protein [Rhizoctonia solani]|nr:Hemopexin-like domain-containing protein [Rhizoctonia solani]